KGGSAVVRQYGLGVSPSGVTAERVPRHKATAVNCRQVAQPEGLLVRRQAFPKGRVTQQKPTCCWVWFRTTSWKQATSQPTKS
nr:hypothetical protein [Calothrix sp. MO_192.B10]